MNSKSIRNNMGKALNAVRVDNVPAVEVGNGCYRRDLTSTTGVRVWVVDILPGGEWPHVDQHDDAGEELYVVSGELIEGDERFEAGTYIFFKPGSSHRPRSEKGCGSSVSILPERSHSQKVLKNRTNYGELIANSRSTRLSRFYFCNRNEWACFSMRD